MDSSSKYLNRESVVTPDFILYSVINVKIRDYQEFNIKFEFGDSISNECCSSSTAENVEVDNGSIYSVNSNDITIFL